MDWMHTTVVEFEAESLGDVQLLDWRHRVIEQLRLTEVFFELRTEHTRFDPRFMRGIGVPALGFFGWWICSEAVRPVVDCTLLHDVAHGAVAVVVHHWTNGAVDGEFLPIYAQARELGVEVGEVATLE